MTKIIYCKLATLQYLRKPFQYLNSVFNFPFVLYIDNDLIFGH